jgi:hypothetical protein
MRRLEGIIVRFHLAAETIKQPISGVKITKSQQHGSKHAENTPKKYESQRQNALSSIEARVQEKNSFSYQDHA